MKSQTKYWLDPIFKDMIGRDVKGEPQVEIIPSKQKHDKRVEVDVADIRFSMPRVIQSANYIFPLLSIKISPCVH